MFKYVVLMVVPIIVFIYTISFGRWMASKDILVGSISAYVIAAAAIALSAITFWRLTF